VALLSRLAGSVRHAKAAAQRIAVHGRSPLAAVMLDVPRIAAGRLHRAIARRVAAAAPFATVSRARLARFHRGLPSADGTPFYVIVMPGTLHFLVPCLRLVPPHVTVHLVANGAKSWERAYLARMFPAYRQVVLATLPASSLAHGDVITMLLERGAGAIGLLDHDCYVFDASCFAHAAPSTRHSMTAWFGGFGAKANLTYPHTFFLLLNCAVLRAIMARHRVDARLYRRVPARLRRELARVGLGHVNALKDHHDFFDTLHLMMALALADGHDVDYVDTPEGAIVHLGGTSSFVANTKTLLDTYMHLRFLDLADDEVRTRYAPRFRPFASAADVRARIAMTPAAFASIASVDAVAARIADAILRQSHGFAPVAPDVAAVRAFD
jgi:hypothetical protein